MAAANETALPNNGLTGPMSQLGNKLMLVLGEQRATLSVNSYVSSGKVAKLFVLHT